MWWMLLWCRISAVELARPCKKLVKVKLTSLWPNFWKCVTPSCIGRHQPTPRTSPALRAPDRARPWLWKAFQEPWTWSLQPLDNSNTLFLEFTPLICLSEYIHLLLVYTYFKHKAIFKFKVSFSLDSSILTHFQFSWNWTKFSCNSLYYCTNTRSFI